MDTVDGNNAAVAAQATVDDSGRNLILTPGPWGWRQAAGSIEIKLCAVQGEMPCVLSPAAPGMNGATIQFGHRTATDSDGLLKAVPVREHGSPDFLRDGELTPDARLIQAAPTLRALLCRVIRPENRRAMPMDLLDEIVTALCHIDGFRPSYTPSIGVSKSRDWLKDENERLDDLDRKRRYPSAPAGGAS